MTKINLATLSSLLALTLTVASPLLAAERMKSGEWEFTSTVSGRGTRTIKHCVTPAEASSVNGDAKAGRAAAEKTAAKNCTVQEYKIVGDTVSYALSCAATTIASTATYHGTSFEGVVTSKRDGKEDTTHVKARFLGACP
jgi:hypothetical protein